MKISLKWLTKYVDVKEYLSTPQKLVEMLTNAGLEVEDCVDQSKQFENVVIGKIADKAKHPQADNLTLCKVDVGTGDLRQIICGAKNHNAGDKVVVSLPGAVLPGNFAIKISKIRGVESQGMLCSEKELGLSSESQGIMILPESAPLGEPFAKYMKMDDVILDVKVTPNRSDCLSHFGLAREIAGLINKNFDFPLTPINENRDSTKKIMKLTIEDTERCPRYAGRVVLGVKVGPSPEWLKKSLESVGMRSINNVVDVTNYVMMELGQPLHAFDIETLEGKHIIVRGATAGEKFKTLDDQDLTLDGTELLICDAKKPVALAGVIGGLNSGITENTKDVFIESAYFQPSTVRRTARRHGLETDASYRFTRGVDIEGVNLAMNRACQLLAEVAQGSVCTDSYDIYPRPVVRARIELDLKFISARLGFNVDGIEAKRFLEKTGCNVSGAGHQLLVNPPTYRTDLKLPEDLGEEILRLKGFQHIPETLPMTMSQPTNDDLFYALHYRLERSLRAQGLHQAVNMSFANGQYEKEFLGTQLGSIQELGIDLSAKSVSLQNPINIDLNTMRVSLLPSLARNVAYNVRHGIKSGGLFEIAPVYSKKEVQDIRNQTRPFSEEDHLGIIMWGEPQTHWTKPRSVPLFYHLKGVIEALLLEWQFKTYKFEIIKSHPEILHPGQSARIFVEGKAVGFLGVLHPSKSDSLELDLPVVVAELNLKNLYQGQPRVPRMKPPSKFPTVERDVAFLCPVEIFSNDIRAELLKAAGQLANQCEVFDLYEGDKLPKGKKSLAFRLTYLDPQRTLSDDEVNALHQKAISTVKEKLHLTIR